jgi:uncharacterized membrane protein YsdA (DUF1294 family)
MVWQYYLIWLAIISVVTFVTYGIDKAQSRRGGQRVPEKYLHGMALIGGFPGGWAGRSIFKHKTQKGFFTFVLALSTILHAGFGYWIISI